MNWGGFWGLLFGAAFFWAPGVGPLLKKEIETTKHQREAD